MALKPPTGHKGTDDKDSFVADKNGEVARNITGCVEIEGGTIDATPSGLNTGFLVTTYEVTDTETLMPVSALTDRNSLSIRNLSETDILYIGNTGVEANENIGTDAGWQVGPNETINLDLTDSIGVYGIAETGKTLKIQTFEAA